MGRRPHPADRRAPEGRLRPRSGFTLVELLIAATLSALVAGAMLALAGSVGDASATIEQNLRGLQSTVDALSAIRQDLPRSRVEAVAPDGVSITYSLPVPVGPGGAFIDASGKILWGAPTPGGAVEGATVTLAFTPERVLDEVADDRDYNADGDRLDAFDLGALSRTTSRGDRLAFPPLEVALVRGDRDGDLDGDGVADPLFALVTDRDEVVVRLGCLTADGVIRVREARCSFGEGNP